MTYAFAVDFATRHRVLLVLDLLRLPTLGLSEGISIPVEDISILINGTPVEYLRVSADKPADHIPRGCNHRPVFGNGTALELGKGALLQSLTLALGDELSLA